MRKPVSKFSCLITFALSAFLSPATSQEPVLSLFSEQNSAEENRLAIIDRYEDWIQEYDRSACNFKLYEGVATPAFFLRWFLGGTLESEMRFAECGDGENQISHILIDVRSPSRAKQRFTISVKSVTKSGDQSPYYSESTYASKGSFIESTEKNQSTKTIYNIHHRYRSKPAELESGEIQHPVDLPNKAHSYASLMTHLSELMRSNETFTFVLTDSYSAAIQDELVNYLLWRNEPLQVIKAKRNTDTSTSMWGWFPYAFGQLNAKIEICFGESKHPDLIKYRHTFMDVDLWRSSSDSSNQCKLAYDKYQAKKQESRSAGSGRHLLHK